MTREQTAPAKPAPGRNRKRLDPDRLAALEAERDHLLRSIRAIDDEHATGDLDDGDHAALRDGYTRRAAETIRAIERQEAAFAAAPGISRRRVVTWVLGLALLGTVAGVLVALSTGERLEGDSISGGVRTSTQALLEQARAQMSSGDYDAVIATYDDLLDDDPSNVEALTYRAWVRRLRGDDVAELVPVWEEVARLDPDYPDRVPFHTIGLADLERWDDAADILDAVDLATAPPLVTQLLEGRGVVGQVYGESRYDEIDASPAVDLDAVGLDLPRALAAAGYLVGSDKPNRLVAALKLYDAVETVDPDNAAALSRGAFLRAQAGLVDEAVALLDRAVEAHPDDPEARLTRAIVVGSGGSGPAVDAACADLEHIEDLMASGIEVTESIATSTEEFARQLGC